MLAVLSDPSVTGIIAPDDCRLFDLLLEAADLIRQDPVGIDLKSKSRIGVLDRFSLKSPKLKPATANSTPRSSICGFRVALGSFLADRCADTDHHILLGVVKRDIECRPVTKGRARIIRIPGRARYQDEVAGAGFA